MVRFTAAYWREHAYQLAEEWGITVSPIYRFSNLHDASARARGRVR